MGMSQSYGVGESEESVATIHAAIDLGVGMLDTSDIYGAALAGHGRPFLGFGHNESLVGRAIKHRRDEVLIATKFGAKLSEQDTVGLDGSPEYIASACEASLRRLGTDHIDLYYCHRLDRNVALEDTVGAMAELVAAGKVRAIGLCEVSAQLLERASRVHPISALQSEYSLWERGVEGEVITACQMLGVTLVPYSPLGRAMLTGHVSADTAFTDDDFRHTIPRFKGENLRDNLMLVDELRAFSEQRDATPGQIALAWLIGQPLDVVPIPGTKRVRYVRENMAALTIVLNQDDMAQLSRIFDPQRVKGTRY
jgi:aryl-alcohol dehydrogenase-like predicted oxidoreductase